MQKLIIKLKKSIWIIPTLYSLIAFGLSIFVVLFDTRTIGNIHAKLPSYFFTQVDLAKEILSTISVALLTIITFTFSTMMIVLTMYSSQFSPRMLPNFLTDHKSTTVLGVFMGSFIYSIIYLFFMRENIGNEGVISATIGILLVIVCLAFFTYFIYHVTSSIQVENLIGKLYKEAMKVIDDFKINFDGNSFIHVSSSDVKKTEYSSEIKAF